MQTVKTLIRRRILRRLIWIYTVCQCPFYGTPGINWLVLLFQVKVDSLLVGFTLDIIQNFNMSRDTAFPKRLNVRPAKTHISLRIRGVWSESLQGTLWVVKGRKWVWERGNPQNRGIRRCAAGFGYVCTSSGIFRVSIQVGLHGLGLAFIISGIRRCIFIFFPCGVNSQNSKKWHRYSSYTSIKLEMR